MSRCARCQEQAERQAEQLKPREVTEGIALVSRHDGLIPYGDLQFPDIRMGDVVRMSLIAGAVEDMGWCEECDAPE